MGNDHLLSIASGNIGSVLDEQPIVIQLKNVSHIFLLLLYFALKRRPTLCRTP
jgi:hypothetical protein